MRQFFRRYRQQYFFAALLVWGFAPSASGFTLAGKYDPNKANEIEAQKLNRLTNMLDLREGKLSPGSPAGTVDRDTLNPTQGPLADHDYVRSICTSWISNPNKCAKWNDPLEPIHGKEPGGDASQLETLLAAEFQRKQGVDSGSNYKIWEINRSTPNAGSNLDSEGKLDLSGVTQWTVTQDTQGKLKDLGQQAGAKVMLASYDRFSTPGQNVMPDRIALNVEGAMLTKQMANRFGGKYAQNVAAQSPSEFLLSEDVPDCESYMAMEQSMNRGNQLQEKLPYQARLSPATAGRTLAQRYQDCLASRQTNFNTVNPQIQNGQVQSGNPEGEEIQVTLNRLNLAAINRAGMDVRSLPKPSGTVLTQDQLTSEFSEFNNGGLSIAQTKKESNAATLISYNNNLEIAAQSMKNVVSRIPGYQPNQEGIRSFKIEPGTKSAVEINGLTADMKNQLAGTSFKSSPLMNATPIPMETKGSELTITRR